MDNVAKWVLAVGIIFLLGVFIFEIAYLNKSADQEILKMQNASSYYQERKKQLLDQQSQLNALADSLRQELAAEQARAEIRHATTTTIPQSTTTTLASHPTTTTTTHPVTTTTRRVTTTTRTTRAS